jgi:hypothetical protein
VVVVVVVVVVGVTTGVTPKRLRNQYHSFCILFLLNLTSR